jgi:hypothetical protein
MREEVVRIGAAGFARLQLPAGNVEANCYLVHSKYLIERV